jgi:hypothetical protein
MMRPLNHVQHLRCAGLLAVTADAFHPWKLSRYIARRQIPVNIVSSYLLDPLWMRVDRQEPAGTRLGMPCEGMHKFHDFFRRVGAGTAGTVALTSPAWSPATLCAPAFTYHWHNQWKTRIRKHSPALHVESWLHARLNLTAPSAQAFHGAWGRP